MRDGGKELYEALQAVNAKLDAMGEQLLVDLVEKIRAGLREEARSHVIYRDGNGPVSTTLERWVKYDAAEREDAPEKWDPEQGPEPGGAWDPDADPPA